jgi:hypothetical protein
VRLSPGARRCSQTDLDALSTSVVRILTFGFTPRHQIFPPPSSGSLPSQLAVRPRLFRNG